MPDTSLLLDVTRLPWSHSIQTVSSLWNRRRPNVWMGLSRWASRLEKQRGPAVTVGILPERYLEKGALPGKDGTGRGQSLD
jgi:hypothetical protein